MRPSIGFATIALLEAAGRRVVVPLDQTCCGQPALNSGDCDGARRVAQRTLALLEPFDAAIVPSGSCAATISHHYPDLFRDDPAWHACARAVAGRTYELLGYLVDIRGWSPEQGQGSNQGHTQLG